MARKLKNCEAGRGFTKADWDEVSDNPELSDKTLEQMRPFGEAFPDLAESVRRTRGAQKAPTKQAVTIRLDRDIIAYFKAEGDGWQSRINAALRRIAKLGGKTAA